MTALLSVRALRRAFGDHVVLDSVELTVEEGEAVAVVGPNGSGKSTLLRCVVGAMARDGGAVLLDGEPLDERSPRVRRDVAVVMDDIDFFPDLSLVEHLDLLARAHGADDVEEVVDDVLEELRLVEVSGHLPSALSSGQRRRLALASALVRPRRLLPPARPTPRAARSGNAVERCG